MPSRIPRVACAAILAALHAATAQQVAGYRRDGTGLYPDACPPAQFSLPADLRWESRLPSWGHGSPIAVGTGAAARVFALCEPIEGERDFPILVCLDAATGRVVWQRDLDHSPALPNGKRDAILAAWHAMMADQGARIRLLRAARREGDPDKGAGAQAFAAAGYQYNARWNKLEPVNRKDEGLRAKAMLDGGFTLETWRHGCSSGSTACIGQAYATPCSDGRHVYCATAFGGFFCYGLDGTLAWLAFSPGRRGEYCRNGRSPLLWGDLLISDITNRTRAFDRATGRLRWSDDGPARVGDDGAHTIVSPMVLTAGGRDILLAAGLQAYLLPDGRKLVVEGWKDYGMQTLVKHDERDVVFFCGAGEHCGWTGKGKGDVRPPAAVRFALDGDTLRATVLWHGGRLAGRDAMGGNAPWMLYDSGRFYHRGGAILDALTGELIAGTLNDGPRRADTAVPRTQHLLCLAGNHVFGLGRGKGKGAGATMEVFTPDGRRVSANAIPAPDGPFSYGYAFTFGGDALYLRKTESILCIGAQEPPSP